MSGKSRIGGGSEDSSLCENAAAIRVLVWLQQGRSDLVISSTEAEVLNVNRIEDKSALLPLAYLSVGNYSMAEKRIDLNKNYHAEILDVSIKIKNTFKIFDPECEKKIFWLVENIYDIDTREEVFRCYKSISDEFRYCIT